MNTDSFDDDIPFVEVGGDIEAALAEQLAESEGMHGVPLPIPGEHREPGLRGLDAVIDNAHKNFPRLFGVGILDDDAQAGSQS